VPKPAASIIIAGFPGMCNILLVNLFPNPDKPELNKILSQRRKDAKILKKFIFVFLCGLCAFA
jgi:hypothetical protein